MKVSKKKSTTFKVLDAALVLLCVIHHVIPKRKKMKCNNLIYNCYSYRCSHKVEQVVIDLFRNISTGIHYEGDLTKVNLTFSLHVPHADLDLFCNIMATFPYPNNSRWIQYSLALHFVCESEMGCE